MTPSQLQSIKDEWETFISQLPERVAETPQELIFDWLINKIQSALAEQLDRTKELCVKATMQALSEQREDIVRMIEEMIELKKILRKSDWPNEIREDINILSDIITAINSLNK